MSNRDGKEDPTPGNRPFIPPAARQFTLTLSKMQ
ncbi:hypothetical protein T4B_13849 [Trichinella pseudospiralis]|uniref:Uncharacterized protein n=1 Tax=Trichinella pseudospiralis TaxID=6337 RepID=A0A0V1E6M6_TRIPS|nr:hypothetical protein T4A_5859 [Trichinella pseudospiralis]KRY96214.1 hypothetical protein T4B_7690 [Trichinella pseudospiralis]KRY96808.1 hypothetical protein T4C_899 [Trichinella pseudospiralis]KRY98293.1 hypothetical protein T4B_13072 [Trichinella pseudospiralis]KRY98614.1 hypothetical protein T4B_15337 [Trichinella pseudospiralis]